MKLPLILLVTVVGTQLTRWMIKEKKLSPIRASTMLTLTFILMTYPFEFELKLMLHSAFLGATFIGMSEVEKMSEKRLFFASIIYCQLFYFVLPYNVGLGGALGFAAFSSCLCVQFMASKLRRN